MSQPICVIYIRVSTDEQAVEGKSPETQKRKLTRYAKEKGYRIATAEPFTDEGFSGSNDNRPGLRDMLVYIQENDVDRVLVVDTDRFARNEQLHFALKAILKRFGVVLESLNQPMIDETPEGAFLDTILAGVNALYPKITGRKTAMTLSEKVELGWLPRQAPVGYLNIDNPAPTCNLDKKIIGVHEVYGPLMTRAFALYSSGIYSGDSLADLLYDEGLRNKEGGKINGGALLNYLKKPFYTGKYYYKGELRQGKHQILIDEETFEKCQRVADERNKFADRSRKHNYLLSGYLTCGKCGSPYTVTYNVGKGWAAYHCTVQRVKHSNKGQHVKVEALEGDIANLFKHIHLPKYVIENIVKKAKARLAIAHNTIDEQRRILRLRQQKAETRQKIWEKKLGDEVVSDATYQRQIKPIEAELIQIEKDLANLVQDRRANVRVFEELMRLAHDIHGAYREAPPVLKRKYIAIFWDQIIIKNKTIEKAVPTRLFQALLNRKSIDKPALTGSVIKDKIWLRR